MAAARRRRAIPRLPTSPATACGPASHREIPSARRARSRHAPRDRRSDDGAGGRPAIRGAHGRAWSSDASSRRSRRDETGSRTNAAMRNASTGKSLPSASNSAPEGKFKSLAVPVIDMIRPVRADRQPRRRGTDRVISDLRAAFRMRRDPRAELHGEHLRAQANSQKRPLLPSGTAIQSISRRTKSSGSLALIGPPKMTAPAWPSSVSGKRIAKARTPDIQPVSERPQRIADAARRRGFLVQDDQHRQQRLAATGGAPAEEAQACVGVGFDRLKRHRLFLRGYQAEIIPKRIVNFV